MAQNRRTLSDISLFKTVPVLLAIWRVPFWFVGRECHHFFQGFRKTLFFCYLSHFYSKTFQMPASAQ